MGLIFRLIIVVFLVVSLPLQITVAILVWVTNGSPMFFRQKRVGKNGTIFVLYKFRTMREGSETMQKTLRAKNESDGPTFKITDDPRFTGIGKFLSHTGLDELPQLWNVLKGEMALIGPRPLPVSETRKLKSWMQKRHDILPGIISPAILTGTYHEDFTAWMKSDISYVRAKSRRNDLTLLFRFVPFILRMLFRELGKMVE